MQSGLLDWQKRIEHVQPITSLEIEPMRWQIPVSINQSEDSDFFYVRVPTIYIVSESLLAFWIFCQINTMKREYRQALTNNYVLLVNETPVNEVLDELVQNKILDHEMREFIRHHPTRRDVRVSCWKYYWEEVQKFSMLFTVLCCP
jgi:hypothetical protein